MLRRQLEARAAGGGGGCGGGRNLSVAARGRQMLPGWPDTIWSPAWLLRCLVALAGRTWLRGMLLARSLLLTTARLRLSSQNDAASTFACTFGNQETRSHWFNFDAKWSHARPPEHETQREPRIINIAACDDVCKCDKWHSYLLVMATIQELFTSDFLCHAWNTFLSVDSCS